MKWIHSLLLVIILLMGKAYPQNINTLSAEQVVLLVKQYHPVAKQADIAIEKAKADITVARGLFDPLLAVKSVNKTFDGIRYYQFTEPEVTIPAWFGIEFNTGLQHLGGSRTDPQETQGRTSYASINVPLVKNLVTDKRRAALQQAKIFKELSEVQKKATLNDLLYDALCTYWNWVQQYQVMEVLKNAVTVNERRFELIKVSYRQGDRPAIDTTEALVQLQSFRQSLNEAELIFQNAGIELSAYLWDDATNPYNLPADVIPPANRETLSTSDTQLPAYDELLKMAATKHPDLIQYEYKINALQVEKKLRFQELLPSLSFRYSQLGKGYNLGKTITMPLLQNNYQYSISFSIPLRLSEGRGEYLKTKLKIQETTLQQSQKEALVLNKVKSYINELIVVKKQLGLQQQQYQNYLILQKGEETRFLNGESSLFLIISRENKTLEAQQKMAELEAKYYKAITSLKWAAGILYN